MPRLTIDGQAVEVRDGATVLDAARTLGIAIPALCHRPDFAPSTSCMVCVVRIDGAPRLVPSCATAAAEGMEVESETPAVRAARRTSLELLASDHTGDCVAPCQRADDHHADLPRFLRQVAAGDVDGAAATLAAAGIPLDDPDTIDLTPAEKACRRGRADEPVTLGRLARWVAERRRYVSGAAPPPASPYRAFASRIAKLSPAELAELLAGAAPGGAVAPDASGRDLSAAAAAGEAARCVHCDCRRAQSCLLHEACAAYAVLPGRFSGPRPPLAIDRSHPEILFEPGKCIRCGLCLQAAERAGEELGLAFAGRGFAMRVTTPFGAPLAAALRTSATTCADVCPTGAFVRRGPAPVVQP
ncbi:MAG: 2Fe-2S iron-sulfur cluster-binding protein [Planctomycetota bacterium]